MNRRKWLSVVALVAILGIALLMLYIRREQHAVTHSLSGPEKSMSPPRRDTNFKLTPGNQSFHERLKIFSELVSYREMNINGKVVDEMGRPVSGATILFGVSRGYRT